MAKLLFQGHGSLRIVSAAGTVVYIDPYAGEGYTPPADLVLISHEHGDHNCTQLIRMKPAGKVFRAAGLLKGGVYGGASVEDVSFRAVPAYNSHHDRSACVGFIIEVDGIKLYAAGDTSKTAEMPALAAEKLDYALLPTDGIYNMDVAEAAQCAALIGAKHTIPIHMKPGALYDETTAARFHAPGALLVRPGEEIAL